MLEGVADNGEEKEVTNQLGLTWAKLGLNLIKIYYIELLNKIKWSVRYVQQWS